MALKKAKELSNGVTGDYWKIETVNVAKNVMTFTLALYLSNEARLANKGTLMCEQHSFNCTLDEYTDNPFAIAYAKLKESRIETRLVSEEVPEQYNNDGELIAEVVPAVYEDVEKNWFADALDC